MRILFQNVGSIRAEGPRKRMAEIIRKDMKHVDIVCIAETHLDPQNNDHMVKLMGYPKDTDKVIFNSPRGRCNGMMMTIRKDLDIVILQKRLSEEGSHIIIKYKHSGKTHIRGGFYGFSGGSDRDAKKRLFKFFQHLIEITNGELDPIINIFGDWNFSLSPRDTNAANGCRKPKTAELFKTIAEHFDLVDLHLETEDYEKDVNGRKGHTFKRPNGNKMTSSRIDRSYVSNRHMKNPFFKNHNNSIDSDHNVIEFDEDIPAKLPPRNYHPDHLLTDQNYISAIHTKCREFLLLNSEAPEMIDQYHDLIPEIPQDENEFPDGFNKEMIETLPPSNENTFVDLSQQYIKLKMDQFISKHMGRASSEQEIPSLDVLGKKASETITNPENTLQSLLSEITHYGMKYNKSKKNSLIHELNKINNKILKYGISNNVCDHNYRHLKERKTQIQETLSAQATASRMARRINNADKYTSYHLKACNIRQKKKKTTEIKDITNPNIIHKNEKCTDYINKTFRKFYQRKEHTSDKTIEDFLSDIPREKIGVIPIEIQQKLDEDINDAEIDRIVEKEHTGSAPGPSGITYQLVKKLYPILKHIIRRFVKETFAKKKLEHFNRVRNIVTLPKPNKPEDQFSSLRPIVLLEITYKLISGVLAERLKMASTYIIDYTQNGYMPQRGTTLCTRTIQDIKDMARKHKMPLTILGLDFSSAFDRITHTFLFKSMEFFGFPPSFIEKIKTLMTDPMIKLCINGEVSEEFKQSAAGSGQGDCVSASLFSICIQILLLKLSYSSKINRFTHTYTNSKDEEITKEYTPVSFADDCHILLQPDGTTNGSNLKRTLEILDEFSEMTDLLLNKSKTELLPIGNQELTKSRAREEGLKIVKEIKFVGAISTEKNHNEECEQNLNGPWAKLLKIMNMYTQRHTTTIGSSVVINSLCIPLFTHLLFNFNPSPEWEEKFEDCCRKFMMSSTNGRHKVAKKRVFIKSRDGGYGVRNMKLHNIALATYWIRQIQLNAETKNNWSSVLEYILDKQGLRMDNVLKLGHLDLLILAQRIEEDSIFWSRTFKKIAKIAELSERECEDLSIVPLIGGELTKKLKLPKLSFFQNDLNFRTIFNMKIYTIQDLCQFIHPNSAYMKLEPPTEYEFRPRILLQQHRTINKFTEFQKSYIYIIKAINKMRKNYFTTPEFNTESFLYNKGLNNLESIVKPNEKGCAKIYELLLDEFKRKNRTGDAPALQTSKERYGHTIKPHEFRKSHDIIDKANVAPEVKKLNKDILLRQNWTRVKEFKSRGTNSTCQMCWRRDQDTEHLYLTCDTAQKYWKKTMKIIKEVTKIDLSVDPSTILFHVLNKKTGIYTKFIHELILTTKYSIYRNSLDILQERIPAPTNKEIENRLFKHFTATTHANININSNYQIWQSAYPKICQILKRESLLKFL